MSKVVYAKLVKGMRKRGWQWLRKTGSHEVWLYPTTGIQTVLPRKKRTDLVGEPFLRQIKQAEAGEQQSRGRRAAEANPLFARGMAKEHRERWRKAMVSANKSVRASYDLFPGDFAGAFNASLDTIKYAAAALAEAENVGKENSSMIRDARKVGRKGLDQARGYLAVAQDVSIRLGRPAVDAHTNPANIPGGNMSACIAIMEARPDVDNAGALCNWLAQKAGEFGRGSRAPKKATKTQAQQRGLLRKAMRI